MNISASFAGKKVLIAGDVMLDEHIQGSVRRLSPEAPVPIVEIQSRRYHPGGSGNVAVNITSLGGTVLLTGVVGNDLHGSRLAEELTARSVSPEYLITAADRHTTSKSRVMAGAHHIVRFDQEDRFELSAEQEEQVARQAAECARQADVCVLSDYAKGVVTAKICQAVIAAAAERGVPVVVDPKGADFAKYTGATVVTPNLNEAKVAASAFDARFHGLDESGFSVDDIAEVIMKRCNASLLITRGPDGMSLFERAKKPVTIKSRARQVFDVTGAGDTVVATLALGLAAGMPLATACWLGNLAAGVVVGELGASAITPHKLETALDGDTIGAP